MKKLLPLLLLALTAVACPGQSFVTVTASKIFNGSSGLLSSGTISFQAVGSSGQAISYQVGGGGQQILFPTICAIENGAIIGICQVANVQLTLPQMLCFSVTVNDASNQLVLGGSGSGYQCVQPTPNSSWCVNGTCNFDNFSPSLPNNITISLPFPTPTNIGGVFSDQCSSNNVVNGISPTGHVNCTPAGGGSGSGNVSNSGTPVAAQLAQWVDPLHIQGITTSGTGSVALVGSPIFTGTPTAPTPGSSDNSTTLATTAFVKAQGYAVLASLAPSATTDTTNAANITSGVLAAGRLPSPTLTSLGAVQSITAPAHNFLNGLSINGIFTTAQPACGDLSNAAASCSTDATNATNISSGTLSLARVPLQGNGSKVLAASTINGATGSEICTDANGNATTVGCTAGGGNVNNSGTPVTSQVAIWVDSTHIQGLSSLPVTAGGLNTGTSPTLGQVPVAISTSAYQPVTVSGDATFANTGVLTVTKTSGAAFALSATTDTTNAANISSGTLPAARLPNPSATTLGGVESLAAVSHKWINSVSTSGVHTATQPACGDLSDSVASCSVDATNATNIGSGTLAIARLPLQGAGTKVLSAGTISGTGASLCTDATGAATTVSCTGGGSGNVSSSGTPTNGQIAQWTSASQVQGISSIPVGNGGLNTTTAPVSGQFPVAASGTAYAPVTMSGDATLASSGAISVIKTGGVAFAASATTNTTNASNITSGTLPHAQLPTLLSGDIPNNAANTSGTAANLSGTPALPNGTTATTQAVADSTTKLATDAFVVNQASSVAPLMDQTSAVTGVSTSYARADHVHPSDTSRAPVASPTFTGTVTLPITGGTSQCLHVSTLGVLSGTGADCGSGGGGMIFPPAGVPQSSGTAWLASLQVGTAANNLLALDGSQNLTLPAAETIATQVTVDEPFEVQSTLPTLAMSTATSLTSKVAFDTDGKLKVSENSGAVTEVAKVNSNITGNSATATALAGTPTQCTGSQFAQGIQANGNANCATPAGGGGGGTTIYSFQAVNSGGTVSLASTSANNTLMWGVSLLGNMTTTGICYYLTVADNTANTYDLGVYGPTGTLLIHLGPLAGTTFSPSTGGHCLSWGTTASLTAGKIYVALTGSAGTARVGGNTTSAGLAQFCSACSPTGGTGATTGGGLNSSVTPPADNWAIGSSQQMINVTLF